MHANSKRLLSLCACTHARIHRGTSFFKSCFPPPSSSPSVCAAFSVTLLVLSHSVTVRERVRAARRQLNSSQSLGKYPINNPVTATHQHTQSMNRGCACTLSQQMHTPETHEWKATVDTCGWMPWKMFFFSFLFLLRS